MHYMDRKRQGCQEIIVDPGNGMDNGLRQLSIRRESVPGANGRDPRRKMRWRFLCLMLTGVISTVSTIVSILYTSNLDRDGVSIQPDAQDKLVSKIAFGSCTASGYSSQPIWVNGVIPSDPDAWIWLGDMAYMDEPHVNCLASPSHPQCNCTSDWLHQPPHSCMAGDVVHALSRVQLQLSNPDYAQFLSFMCPDHRSKGLIPPTGTDSLMCPRRIFGTYDDHDFGWDNGNKRLPHKDDFKNIYLDAVGEPTTSPRRKSGRGIEWKYTLNEGKRQEIDVLLLDERYNRDTLPCHIRQAYCETLVSANVQHEKYSWCFDFIHGGDMGAGSCCSKDDKIFYGWCKQKSNKGSFFYEEACNPISSVFGARSLIINSSGQLVEIPASEESSFCEVLGKEQRQWLQEMLFSNSPLKLLVSSSVVLGNPKAQSCEDVNSGGAEILCPCSGDDWECYKPAQLQLLNLISQARGCVVILTGDYQYSDIRMLRPNQEAFTQHYKEINLSYPLFQVMASGLTTSSAPNFTCDAKRSDPLGLRAHKECDFVRGPAFGMIKVDWDEPDPIVRLQIRDGKTGGLQLESSFILSNCLPTND